MVEFIKFDGGRKAAGFKGSAGDCGVRSAAIALGEDYQETYDALYQRQKAFKDRSRKVRVKLSDASPRTGVWKEVMHAHMTEAGAVWVPLASIGGEVVRVKDVATRWPGNRVVMRLARHYSAMVNGVNMDTWPQHPDKRVYGVWVVEDT